MPLRRGFCEFRSNLATVVASQEFCGITARFSPKHGLPGKYRTIQGTLAAVFYFSGLYSSHDRGVSLPLLKSALLAYRESGSLKISQVG